MFPNGEADKRSEKYTCKCLSRRDTINVTIHNKSLIENIKSLLTSQYLLKVKK